MSPTAAEPARRAPGARRGRATLLLTLAVVLAAVGPALAQRRGDRGGEPRREAAYGGPRRGPEGGWNGGGGGWRGEDRGGRGPAGPPAPYRVAPYGAPAPYRSNPYAAPPQYGGYGYGGGRAWRRGEVLPEGYRGAAVPDPGRYHLRRAPNGYGWVGDARNAYLMQRSTGMVLDSVPGAYEPPPPYRGRRR